MAFRARTAENVPQGKMGAGRILELDGVSFGPRMRRYEGKTDHGNERLVDSKGRPFGAPTAEMLANDRLIVRTLEDLPWPGSSEDRHAKGACLNGMANALSGAASPFGAWPTAGEQTAQSNFHFARKDPESYAERIIAQRPYKREEQATIRGKAAALAAGMDPERFSTSGIEVESLPEPTRRGGESLSDEGDDRSGRGGKRRAG